MLPVLRDDVSKKKNWPEKCFLCKAIKSYAMTNSAAAEFKRSERRERKKNSITSVDIEKTSYTKLEMSQDIDAYVAFIP